MLWMGPIHRDAVQGQSFSFRSGNPEGKAIIEKRPVELSDVDSVFFVDDEGNWTAKSTAALQIVRQLRFPWPIASIGLLVPRFIRDAVYDAYAKRRFRGSK